MGKIRDLTGQRFGRLVVLELSDRKTKSNSAIWKCQCDCGITKEIISPSLVKGDTRSCGCLCKEELKQRRFNDRTGESRVMKNGLNATIIAYRTKDSVDIRFENGEIVHNREYRHFKNGHIRCPMHVEYVEDYAKVTNPNPCDSVTTLMDIEDLNLVSGKYLAYCNGYIVYEEKGKQYHLHRVIMDCPQGMQVDHINGDRADNRKSNLRICTMRNNNKNRLISSNNTSGYKGVSWNKAKRKWWATIIADKSKVYLGAFDTPEEAAKVYNAAALKYHGEFAKLNEI